MRQVQVTANGRFELGSRDNRDPKYHKRYDPNVDGECVKVTADLLGEETKG